MGMKTFYLLHTLGGGIEAKVLGPYETMEERDNQAKEHHKLLSEDDAVLWMDVDPTAVVQVEVGSYTGGFFMEG